MRLQNYALPRKSSKRKNEENGLLTIVAEDEDEIEIQSSLNTTVLIQAEIRKFIKIKKFALR